MLKILDKFLLMTQEEANGVNVLIVVLIFTMLFRLMMPLLFDDVQINHKTEEKYALIERHIKEMNPQKRNHAPLSQMQAMLCADNNETLQKKKQEEYGMVFSEFDPNTATYSELTKAGISSKAASTLIKYREKGAHFYKPYDMTRVYGIDSATVKNLLPYIVIKKQERVYTSKIEINTADTTELKEIVGVGQVFAKRICKYRTLLGGFCSADQLKEVYGFTDEMYTEIAKQITVDNSHIKKIDINFASERDLRRHPYIKDNIAEAIVKCRADKGPFKSCSELVDCGIMGNAEFEKIEPYLRIRN